MTEQFITYFGYGSLVNRETRPASEQAFPARLYGWRRVWGHRVHTSDETVSDSARFCCSLSVEKSVEKSIEKSVDKGAAQSDANIGPTRETQIENSDFIDGVVVRIPLSDLPILDAREAGYDRLKVPASDFELPGNCTDEHIHVYVSDTSHSGHSNEHYPILQSYIDCVLAGYCAVFEHAGMQHFVDSTVGWDGVILNERGNPLYPRAVQLPESQLALFDSVVDKYRSK